MLFQTNRCLFLAFYVALAYLTVVFPANAEGKQKEPLKIVSSLPRTGSANAQTTTIVNGIRLALEKYNYRLGNHQLIYEDWDDSSPERGTWDPGQEARNADRAISDQQVVAYLGPYNSGAAKISMPKLNQARLLQVSMGTSYAGLTKAGFGEPNEPDVYRPSGKLHFFRLVPGDDLQGSVGAQWAKEMAVGSVYVLHDRELYGKGIADVFAKTAASLGMKVLASEGIDSKSTNYRALATKIRATKAELVFFGGTTQSNAGQLLKDLRASGVKAKFMGPDGCFEQAFIQAAGKDASNQNTFITFGGMPANQLQGAGADFYKEYKAKFNAEPEAYAAYGYESAMVVLASLTNLLARGEVVEKNLREELINEVSQLRNYAGVLGTWSFDQNGDTSLTAMSGMTIENGEFKLVKILHSYAQ